MFEALGAGLLPLEWLELCFAELFGHHPRLSWRQHARALERSLTRADRYGGREQAGLLSATEHLRARAEQWALGAADAPVSLAWLVPVLDESSKQLRRWYGRTAVERAERRKARPETVARRVDKRGRATVEGRPETNDTEVQSPCKSGR